MSDSYFFDSRLAKTAPKEYVTDKERSTKTYLQYMNIRLQKMFHYEGLPDSVPREMLEYNILNNGTCYIAKNDGEGGDGKLYALLGSYGGEPDAYYRPTKYTVANPALKLTKTYELWTDGVMIRNDSLWIGLYPMMARYAYLMAENTLTLRTADVMLRLMAMLTAPNDATKIAADEYLKNLENGKLGTIGEKRFMDEGVKLQTPPSNNGSYLTQFIELHQYLTGTFYNEIGLNANFNMKRESIGQGESALNEDSLLPLCEDMLQCRQEDFAKVNAMFGTNITVEFDSSWLNNQKEVALGLEKLKNEASQLAGGQDENGGIPGNGGDGEESEESEESTSDDNSEQENGDSDEPDTNEDAGDSGDDTEGNKSEDSIEDERGEQDNAGESDRLDDRHEESTDK